MAKKADAWKEYKEAAMVDMMLQTLPKVKNMQQTLPKEKKTTDDNDTNRSFTNDEKVVDFENLLQRLLPKLPPPSHRQRKSQW